MGTKHSYNPNLTFRQQKKLMKLENELYQKRIEAERQFYEEKQNGNIILKIVTSVFGIFTGFINSGVSIVSKGLDKSVR